ncbi:ATP-binding cassette domain-containing protein [Flavobacteriaceae bacterium S356]|uniref:ATP-binding cassette domain-containing protein n=1 Tax=Asprobacillus argus TaxID=3076534 RepID=A0ABU3LDS6_9FLAO|nr:ATP-binding cassette domain-containing protein [Flavobacteriaceae bacterium S356]
MTKKFMSSWQRFVGLLRLDKRDVLQILYYAVFAGVVSLTLPLGIQAIINLIQGAQMSTSWILLVILVTLGVAFSGLLQLAQMRIIENVQQKIFTRASFEFAYRFPKIRMSELRNYYPPELANRFFDTLTIQKGISKILIDFPAAFLQIILGLLLLSFYHPFFIIYGILLMLLVYIVFKFTAQKGLETSLEESKNKYKVAHWLQEIARTIISFKMAGKTKHALNKNDELVSDYLIAREGHFRILVLQFIQMIGFKVLVTAGLLIIGGILVINQQMNIGQFVAAEIIILLVISSVEKLILGLESFYDVLTSLEKMGQVVDKELESQEGENPAFNHMNIELSNVSYNPEGVNEHILKDIDLHISDKESLLIQGENGSGKTSLLKLIAGVLEPTHGSIYVNDKSLTAINLNHYRFNIGQSLTEDTPFEGTIIDNITFGDSDFTSEEIDWAIRHTGLNEFIKQQPKGMKTILYPEGKQISYTISKKIILARNIIRKPKLLILKEPLEYFDPKEAKTIMSFLTSKERPWTLVVVSHNKDWAVKCSRVITLKKGKLKA